MSKYIFQGFDDEVIEKKPKTIDPEQPRASISRVMQKVLVDMRKFGRDLKNVDPNATQSHQTEVFIKEEKNNPLKIPKKPQTTEQQPRPSFKPSTEDAIPLSKIKPPTPSKQFIAKRESNIFAISERQSFATDIEKYIKPATSEYKQDFIKRDNPQDVKDYVVEIFQYLRQNEGNNLPNREYLKSQPEINEKMRAILLDWLVSVNLKLRHKNETLFLTVNIIDRYLSIVQEPKNKLQLVGIVALLIAGKYEEIYPPNIELLIELTDKTYLPEEVLEYELKIISTLKFRLTFGSSNLFTDRYAEIFECDKQTLMLARYMLELAMIEYKMLKYTPNMLASSAICLACKLFRRTNSWSSKMTIASGYIEAQLMTCMKDLLFLLKYSRETSLYAIVQKYEMENFMRVARLNFFELARNA